MKIFEISIILLFFVNLIRGQSEIDDNRSETELMGDSGWWSRRIAKINRKEEPEIGLASKDKQRQSSRKWREKMIIRDSRRRPRPFSSVVHSAPLTQDHDRFESHRKFVRNDDKKIVDLNVPAIPSPILRPPYATPTPVYRNDIFNNEQPTSEWNNESSLNTGKSIITPALERIIIYEITTLNSTNNGAIESESSHLDDSSRTFHVNNEKNHWINFAHETRVNRTRNYEIPREEKDNEKFRNSIYIDEKLGNEITTRLMAATNKSNPLKSSRGNRRYQDNFKDHKSFMRKQFDESDRYDWRRRNGQRSNHFRFIDDSNTKVGSVPGIPGRDYPIHQEHTHHHLRNTADRFPCPRSPKTHVYLADRASRCQIFYVCYGSMTGVPMVCPNGTLFSEPLQVCDWWFNVVC